MAFVHKKTKTFELCSSNALFFNVRQFKVLGVGVTGEGGEGGDKGLSHFLAKVAENSQNLKGVLICTMTVAPFYIPTFRLVAGRGGFGWVADHKFGVGVAIKTNTIYHHTLMYIL